MSRHFFRCMGVLLCSLMLIVQPYGAMAAPVVQLEAEMGYEGTITYVRKLPVTISVTNQGPDLSGKLVMDVNRNDSEFDRYEMPVTVAEGTSARFVLPVVLTQRQQAYSVRLVQGDATIAQTDVKLHNTLAPSTLFVGALADDPQKLTWLTIARGSDPRGYLPISRGEYWGVVPLNVETFPTDAESMRFFDILVVDAFDMNTLTQPQQQAFEKWLREGGIVLLGGGKSAQTGYPFFTPYTGISNGALSDTEDVSQTLLSVFGIAASPVGKSTFTVELNGASGTRVGNIVDVSRVEDGYVFTAAFALGEKPLSTWMGENVIWQRMLMTYAQTRYKTMVEQRTRGSYDTQDTFADQSVMDLIRVKNGDGMGLPMLLIGLFVALVGFGVYWLLKRFDRREWMWALVPLLSIVTSLAMWGLSAVLPLRDPVEVHYTLAQVDEEGNSRGFTAVNATQAARGPMLLSAEEGTIDFAASISYYAFPDDNAKDTAAKLRYICTYGDRETITYPAAEAWRKRSAVVKDAPMPELRGLKGACRWEGDSLAITLTNGTAVALDEGVVITEMGFVTAPALLPGQTTTLMLRPAAAVTPAEGQQSTPGNEIKDGVLLDDQARQRYEFYQFLDAYIGLLQQNANITEQKDSNIKRSLISSAAGSFFDNQLSFVYFGFSDEMDSLKLQINGQPVSRSAQRGCVALKLRYDPISVDGTARFLKDSFPVFTATVGKDGRPLVGEPLKTTQYQTFALAANPIFAFDVSAIPDGMQLTRMDIALRYSYCNYRISLFNVNTGGWDEYKLYLADRNTGLGTSTSRLPELAAYLDDHFLFARFEKPDLADEYVDVSTPLLTMDGRVN